MKKPWFLRGIRKCGGWGFAPTTPYAVLFSGQGASHHPASRGGLAQSAQPAEQGCSFAPTVTTQFPPRSGYNPS